MGKGTGRCAGLRPLLGWLQGALAACPSLAVRKAWAQVVQGVTAPGGWGGGVTAPGGWGGGVTAPQGWDGGVTAHRGWGRHSPPESGVGVSQPPEGGIEMSQCPWGLDRGVTVP